MMSLDGQDSVIVPVGNNKIIICHWEGEGGAWQAIEINHNGLNGHDNHDYDVWPPVEGVTDGQNWPKGEDMYLNDCTLNATATATPEPSESPTGTLPPTGASLNMAVLAVAMIASGAWMKWKAQMK
jgi:hypothetical protein